MPNEADETERTENDDARKPSPGGQSLFQLHHLLVSEWPNLSGRSPMSTGIHQLSASQLEALLACILEIMDEASGCSASENS